MLLSRVDYLSLTLPIPECYTWLLSLHHSCSKPGLLTVTLYSQSPFLCAKCHKENGEVICFQAAEDTIEIRYRSMIYLWVYTLIFSSSFPHHLFARPWLSAWLMVACSGSRKTICMLDLCTVPNITCLHWYTAWLCALASLPWCWCQFTARKPGLIHTEVPISWLTGVIIQCLRRCQGQLKWVHNLWCSSNSKVNCSTYSKHL